MDPWTIIGWALVSVLGLAVLLTLGIALLFVRHVIKSRLHIRKMLAIKPAVGQVWEQEGSRLRIMHIRDDGSISITSGCVSWSDSPETWRNRVRGRNLTLIRDDSRSPDTSGWR